MDYRELLFINIVNAKMINKFRDNFNHLFELDCIEDYEILNFMLRDIVVILKKGYDYFNDDERVRVHTFFDRLSKENNIEAEMLFDSNFFCTDENILMSVSLFYQNEKIFVKNDIRDMSMSHMSFCTLKAIVLDILWDNDVKYVTEGILYLTKYFDMYEDELLNRLCTKKTTNINIEFPNYEQLLNICEDSNLDKRLLSIIKKLTFEIKIDLKDEKIYIWRECSKCFSLLDEIFVNKTVIICRKLLEECYSQEVNNYKEIIDENPYDEKIDFVFETDNHKKNIEDIDKMFGKIAFINSEERLVTDYVFDSIEYVNDYVIVKKDLKYGWLNKNDMYYVEPQYDKVEHQGRLWLKVYNNDTYMIVDYKNNVIHKDYSKYDDIKLLGDFVLVSKDNKWGLLNTNDELCLSLVYDDIEIIGELIITNIVSKNIKLVYNKKFIIIMSFDLKVSIEYCHNKNVYKYRVDENYGYFNEKGEILFPALYEYCELYKNSISFGDKENKKILFNSNKSIMDVRNKKHFEINENDIVVCDNYMVKIIDEKTLEERIFESQEHIQDISDLSYCNNLVPETCGIILKCNDKYGVIDLNAELIMPFEYDYIYEALYKEKGTNEYYYHMAKKYNDEYLLGMAKIDGTIVLECEYDDIGQDKEGNWVLEKNGCRLTLDSEGTVLELQSPEIEWN